MLLKYILITLATTIYAAPREFDHYVDRRWGSVRVFYFNVFDVNIVREFWARGLVAVNLPEPLALSALEVNPEDNEVISDEVESSAANKVHEAPTKTQLFTSSERLVAHIYKSFKNFYTK